MYVYISDFMSKLNKSIEVKENYFDKKIVNYKDIYSHEGIFRIKNNILYKLIPNDYPCEKYMLNNINFIIDKSKYIFLKDVYCIPYKNIVYNIHENRYKLNSKSNVELIVKYNNSALIDIYFYVNEEKLSMNSKNNILEFFSLLCNNKEY